MSAGLHIGPFLVQENTWIAEVAKAISLAITDVMKSLPHIYTFVCKCLLNYLRPLHWLVTITFVVCLFVCL